MLAYMLENRQEEVQPEMVEQEKYEELKKKLESEKERDELQIFLKEQGVPTMVYYPKPMHKQGAFSGEKVYVDLLISGGWTMIPLIRIFPIAVAIFP